MESGSSLEFGSLANAYGEVVKLVLINQKDDSENEYAEEHFEVREDG